MSSMKYFIILHVNDKVILMLIRNLFPIFKLNSTYYKVIQSSYAIKLVLKQEWNNAISLRIVCYITNLIENSVVYFQCKNILRQWAELSQILPTV